MKYILQAGFDGQYGPFDSMEEAADKAEEVFSLEMGDREALLDGRAVPYSSFGEVIEIYEVED